jgi:hypothetical protein
VRSLITPAFFVHREPTLLQLSTLPYELSDTTPPGSPSPPRHITRMTPKPSALPHPPSASHPHPHPIIHHPAPPSTLCPSRRVSLSIHDDQLRNPTRLELAIPIPPPQDSPFHDRRLFVIVVHRLSSWLMTETPSASRRLRSLPLQPTPRR